MNDFEGVLFVKRVDVVHADRHPRAGLSQTTFAQNDRHLATFDTAK